jgi:hypothetical protein
MFVCGTDSSAEIVKSLPPVNKATDIRLQLLQETFGPTERLTASPLQIIHML